MGTVGSEVEQLARWWTQATQEARLEALRDALHPEATRQDFQTLRLAIILAEIEAGQVEER